MTTTDGGPSPLTDLLALQDLDVHRQQLAHRRTHLPEAAALSGLEGQLATLNSEAALVEQDRARLAGERDALDGDAHAASVRIATIEERLRSGAAGSFRDQEAMAAEVASLTTRRAEIEDAELLVMEALEPVEAAVDALAQRRRELEAEREEAKAALAAAASALDAEAGELATVRPALVEKIPPELLSTYDRLAKRLSGVAIARVVHGTCDGCRLALSATELDHLRHHSAGLSFCEQCGRILVL